MMFQPVTTSGSRARTRRHRVASRSASLAHGTAAAGQAARAAASGHSSSTSRVPYPHSATDSRRCASGSVSMSSDSVVSRGVQRAGSTSGSSNTTVSRAASGAVSASGRAAPWMRRALLMPRSIR